MITRDRLKKEQSWFYKAGYEMGFRDGLANRKKDKDELDKQEVVDAERLSHCTNEDSCQY